MGNLFSEFKLGNPIAFGVTYFLTFSATKQIGAFLFSLTFFDCYVYYYEERNPELSSCICHWYCSTVA